MTSSPVRSASVALEVAPATTIETIPSVLFLSNPTAAELYPVEVVKESNRRTVVLYFKLPLHAPSGKPPVFAETGTVSSFSVKRGDVGISRRTPPVEGSAT